MQQVAFKGLSHYPSLSFSFSLFAVTGSCFFIFSSALKASAGYFAKSSIVEGTASPQRGNFSIMLKKWKLLMSLLQESFIQTMLIFVCVCLRTPYQTVCLGVPACACIRTCAWPPLCACVFLRYLCSTFCRWFNGADHRGNHGRAAAVTARDERLHCHLWAARPIREPGACLCTVGGGEMHCEQRASVST